MARFLYFAWVREKIGTPNETLELPADINSVAAVMDHLKQLGDNYKNALSDANLRVAVNQTYSQPDSPVSNSDEIAIFPPVSGG